MQGPISAKHQFSCPVVISVITISVNSFNNKLQDPLYHCILHMHWHLRQNPIQWLYDQRIPCLQGCLVELHWRISKCSTVNVAVMKKVQKDLSDHSLQQCRIEISTLLKYL